MSIILAVVTIITELNRLSCVVGEGAIAAVVVADEAEMADKIEFIAMPTPPAFCCSLCSLFSNPKTGEFLLLISFPCSEVYTDKGNFRNTNF